MEFNLERIVLAFYRLCVFNTETSMIVHTKLELGIDT